ncbi:hypothetical protein OG895_18075 [Streptomyces sp. NBC_00201]|uniref:hypothetical protein n=1 Tax=Streptomyces sp. NBC_00201 TaxID=2975679 RepID=UPI0022514246|nr:hypothetical protein [Streptomyces sp. NBC_00201]MCX5247111.1 hypothetical protein [Streptomyces sp. NBC_00201]
MGHTVRLVGLPHIQRQDQDYSADTPTAGVEISLCLELPRVTDSNMAMGQVARAVLSAIGTPAWMLQDLAETARVAAQYMVLHSTAPSYQLLLSADEDGVTVAVTDYTPPVLTAPPAWQPVTHDNRAEPRAPFFDGMQVHRTPDGHLRLRTESRWRKPAPSV